MPKKYFHKNVQSVIFRSDLWTLKDAQKWLKQFKFKTKFRGKGVDRHIKSELRFRQHDPGLYIRFRVLDLGNGIDLVLGY
jgi:hypothetical protein